MTRSRHRRFASPTVAAMAVLAVASCSSPSGPGRAATPPAASSRAASTTAGVTVPRAPDSTAATRSASSVPDAAAPTTALPAPAPPVTAPGAIHAGAAPTDAAGTAERAAACPQNLAEGLTYTGSARQLISAEAAGYGSTVATVEIWQRNGGCWTPAGGPWRARIGENGFSNHHIEGDGTSPTGAFGIGPVIYGNAADPGVQETYHRLVCGDWWDEDPRSAQYNTFQHVPCGTTPSFGGGSEALWTETDAYPALAVIDYNTGPAVPYAGSGIFLRADTGTPTDGCIALPLAQLDQVLRWLNPADSPLVVMGPASEITRF